MESLLEEWGMRLGLSDWVIKLEDNCEPDEMEAEDCVGCASYTEVNKCAKIQILDPKFYGNRLRPFDYEKTLVHELLHIKMGFIGDGVSDLQERVVHQIIDDLARAFVDAKRQGQKHE